MGVSNGAAAFLIECRGRCGPLKETLTLGRLAFRAKRIGRLHALLTKRGIADIDQQSLQDTLVGFDGVDKFLEILGATKIDSLDISSYGSFEFRVG